jgi:tetratricopeptide (TPR) repeat protein
MMRKRRMAHMNWMKFFEVRMSGVSRITRCCGILLIVLAAAELRAADAPATTSTTADTQLPTSSRILQAAAVLEAGKTQEALEQFTLIIDSASGTAGEHYTAALLRGQAFVQSGKPDKALRDFQSIIDSSRASHFTKACAWYGRMSIHNSQGAWKATVDDATQLLSFADQNEIRAIKPGMSRGLIIGTRALAYHKLGDQRKALAECNNALGDLDLVGGQRATTFLLRAQVYVTMDKWTEAAADCQWVINSPDTPEMMRAAASEELKSIRAGVTTKPTSH